MKAIRPNRVLNGQSLVSVSSSLSLEKNLALAISLVISSCFSIWVFTVYALNEVFWIHAYPQLFIQFFPHRPWNWPTLLVLLFLFKRGHPLSFFLKTPSMYNWLSIFFQLNPKSFEDIRHQLSCEWHCLRWNCTAFCLLAVLFLARSLEMPRLPSLSQSRQQLQRHWKFAHASSGFSFSSQSFSNLYISNVCKTWSDLWWLNPWECWNCMTVPYLNICDKVIKAFSLLLQISRMSRFSLKNELPT